MSNVTVSKLSDGTNVGYFAPQAYFECSTASNTSAKVATSPDSVAFSNTSLVRGITVYVKFANASNIYSPTLQVGTSTAKPIVGDTKWAAGDVVSFTYDGTNWVVDNYTRGVVRYRVSIDFNQAYTSTHYLDIASTLKDGSGLVSKTANDVIADINGGKSVVIIGDGYRLFDDDILPVAQWIFEYDSTITEEDVTIYLFKAELPNGDKHTQFYVSFGSSLDNQSFWHINSTVVFIKSDIPIKDTTYTFTSGTNGFTVTPSGGTAQTVTVTPSIANNVTGTGTSGSIAKFDGTNSITDGPAFDSNDTDKHLRHDGTWVDTAYRTSSIPYGQVDSTSTSTAYTVTVPGITELRDGVCVWLKNGVVTSEAGFTINVNNLGAKPSYTNLAAATADTTIFNVNYTMLFVYDSTRVSGGCWVCYRGYDSNSNTIGYQLRTNSMSMPVSGQTGRYRILFTSADGTKYVPANTSSSTSATAAKTVNTTAIDPFGDIRYYSSTTVLSSGSRPGTSSLWGQYTLTLGYSFNRTGSALTMTSWKPVYVKCAPQADGSAVIDADNPFVQALPSTEDGKIYIFLGVAYAATTIELLAEHPVYYYKNNGIRHWTGQDIATPASVTTAITAAIEALDVTNITDGLSASKTITALSETDGLIEATASDIAIGSGQVTKDATNVTIATSDVLPVFDNSDSNKLKGSIAFDTSNTTDFLRKDGTWATVTSGGTYTGGSGIDITNNVVSVDLATNSGLGFDSNNKLLLNTVPLTKGGTGIAVADAGNWYTSMTLHPHFEVHFDADTTTFTAVYHGPLDGISSVQTALQSDAVKMALSSEVPVFSGSALLFNGTIMTNAMGGSPESVFILFPDAVTFLTLIVNGINGTLTYNSNDGLYLSSVAANQPYWYTTWRPSLFFDGLNGDGQLGPSRTLDTLYQSNGVIYASATDIAITSDKVTKYSTDATIATGDKIGIFDSSDSNKLKSTSISFDTTNTSDFLRKDGTFATPPDTGDFDHIIEVYATPNSDGTYTVTSVVQDQATILSWVTSSTDTCAALLHVAGGTVNNTYLEPYTLLLPKSTSDWALYGANPYDDDEINVRFYSPLSTWGAKLLCVHVSAIAYEGEIDTFGVNVVTKALSVTNDNISSGVDAHKISNDHNAVTAVSGDRLAFFDASDGNRLKKAGAVFTGRVTDVLKGDGYFGRLPVHTYISQDLGLQADSTPTTGTLLSGQLSQGVYASMKQELELDVLPVFIDKGKDFAFDGADIVRVFYAIAETNKATYPEIRLIYFPPLRTGSSGCELLTIYSGDTCDVRRWDANDLTFVGGTNSFTVTPVGGAAQTVTITPSIDTSSFFLKTGGEITGDVTLLKSGTTPGDSHALTFQRGTLTDNYNDWRIQDRGGFLYFDQRGSNSVSWSNQVVFNTSGNISASSFSGSGASLTSLNASNISSGTLDSARLPSGLEYTTNKVTSISSSSTDDQYASAKCTYDVIDAKESKGKITISGTEYTVSRQPLTITDGNTTTTYYVAVLTT